MKTNFTVNNIHVMHIYCKIIITSPADPVYITDCNDHVHRQIKLESKTNTRTYLNSDAFFTKLKV